MTDDCQGLGYAWKTSNVLSKLDSHLEHLPICHREDVVRVIQKYPSLFSDVPGRTTVLCHDIAVGTSLPIKQHLYRLNPAMKNEVEYLLNNGLAVHSQSPWSSPCLLVQKPGSSFLFCTDYRKFNSVTKTGFFSFTLH